MKPPRHEITAAFVTCHPPDAVRRAMAIRLAKACREIIQTCLREEEWSVADQEFHRVILAGLEELAEARREVVPRTD